MHVNLVFAWLLIVLGVVFGMGIGSFFHREDWWGGYASHRRRLYRLAHVSFFGLAILNLLFYFTMNGAATAQSVMVASWCFVVGGASMPIVAVVFAHRPNLRVLFAVPVIAVLLGSAITLQQVWRP